MSVPIVTIEFDGIPRARAGRKNLVVSAATAGEDLVATVGRIDSSRSGRIVGFSTKVLPSRSGGRSSRPARHREYPRPERLPSHDGKATRVGRSIVPRFLQLPTTTFRLKRRKPPLTAFYGRNQQHQQHDDRTKPDRRAIRQRQHLEQGQGEPDCGIRLRTRAGHDIGVYARSSKGVYATATGIVPGRKPEGSDSGDGTLVRPMGKPSMEIQVDVGRPTPGIDPALLSDD